jgi:nucleoside-diphosphate-sugar epimerase
MKSRLVSVTGATGFFGGHIAEAFLRAGWRVRGVVRRGSVNQLPPGLERCEAELATEPLKAAFDGSALVVHAAGLARSRAQEALWAVNVGGSRAVVDAVNATGSRLIVISSQAAAGTGTIARPSREDDDPRPLTAYGRSKLAAEVAVKEHARVPWTVLRPSAIYGPRDRQFLPLFRMAARGRFFLAARPDTPFTLVDVSDAALAVAAAASTDRAIGRTFFVGHADPHTAHGLLMALARAAGKPEGARRLPPTLLWLAALGGEVAWRCGFTPVIDVARWRELRADGFVCAIARARDELGFTAATPLQEGLTRTWKWYRDQGWI